MCILQGQGGLFVDGLVGFFFIKHPFFLYSKKLTKDQLSLKGRKVIFSFLNVL